MIEQNYKERIKKLKTILSIWRARSISLKGKVTVIWSVALPQMLYVCQCLYTPPWVIIEVDEILFQLLWLKRSHM